MTEYQLIHRMKKKGMATEGLEHIIDRFYDQRESMAEKYHTSERPELTIEWADNHADYWRRYGEAVGYARALEDEGIISGEEGNSFLDHLRNVADCCHPEKEHDE